MSFINLFIKIFFFWIRGLTREEAQLEYILIAQQLEGYGDEYYPAKVSSH